MMRFDYKEIIIRLKTYSAGLLLLLFYLTEGIGKIAFYHNEVCNVQQYTKLVVLIVLCIEFLFHIIERTKLFILTSTIILIFCLGQWQLSTSFSTYSLITLSKYIFPLILFQFYYYNGINEKGKKFLFIMFEWILILNGFLILIGLLTDSYIFNTYKYGRFGYDGLLRNSSTASYVYTTAVAYLLFIKKMGLRQAFFLLTVLFPALLIGTKAIYLAIFILFLAYTFTKVNSKTKRKILVIGILIISAAAGYYIYCEWSIFVSIRQEKGLLSALLSFRNELLLEKTMPDITHNWSLGNYFFGGISEPGVRSQLGFLDLAQFFGLIGCCVYLNTYWSFLAIFKLDNLAAIVTIMLLIIIALSGNFFINPTTAIYALILSHIIVKNQENTT